MSKQYVKHFSLYLLICLICNTTIAQTKKSKFILNEWTYSNLVNPNSKKNNFYKQKLAKFVPKGYIINLIYKGLISSDKAEDFCIILNKIDDKKGSTEWATNDRPLIVIINTINNTFTYRNDSIVSPYYVTKGTCGIIMKKNYLYILSRINSKPDNESLFAEIFKYNIHKKIVFDRYSEFNEISNQWFNIEGKVKKGVPFEIYGNQW